MTELWYPPAIKTDLAPESSLGHYTGGAAKGLLHTTESWVPNHPGAQWPDGKYLYGPALGVYKKQGYWPQFTHTIERGFFETYQHIAIDRPGKALEHPSGTGETNNDNVVQAEICWGANRAPEMPRIMLDGLAAWMRWVEKNHGVERKAIGFGVSPTRFTWPAWHAFSGWCGHQHVPNNSHGDPGAIDIAYLLGAAPQPQEDDMRFILKGHPTKVYVTDLLSKHWIQNWNSVAALEQQGVKTITWDPKDVEALKEV